MNEENENRTTNKFPMSKYIHLFMHWPSLMYASELKNTFGCGFLFDSFKLTAFSIRSDYTECKYLHDSMNLRWNFWSLANYSVVGVSNLKCQNWLKLLQLNLNCVYNHCIVISARIKGGELFDVCGFFQQL